MKVALSIPSNASIYIFFKNNLFDSHELSRVSTGLNIRRSGPTTGMLSVANTPARRHSKATSLELVTTTMLYLRLLSLAIDLRLRHVLHDE